MQLSGREEGEPFHWIAAPEASTEHPNWHQTLARGYVSQLLDPLTSNPNVWSKTVFFLNFDEEGGCFDHVVSPTPPQTPAQGASTVGTVNEIYTTARRDYRAPTGMWTAQQVIDAFPDDSAPAWLLRDRDAIYGEIFRRRVASMACRGHLESAKFLAESVCRAPDRFHASRVSSIT